MLFYLRTPLIPALRRKVDLWVQGQYGLYGGFQDNKGYKFSSTCSNFERSSFIKLFASYLRNHGPRVPESLLKSKKLHYNLSV